MDSRIHSKTPPLIHSLAATTLSNDDIDSNLLGSSSNSQSENVPSLKQQISNVHLINELMTEVAEIKNETSPSKADNTAVEPLESAHFSNYGNDANLITTVKEENGDEVNLVSSEEIKTEMEVKETDPSESACEKKLTNDALKEEPAEEHSIETGKESLYDQECLKNLNEERYQRLQVLLIKCNAYTQYLLQRMKKQEEKEKWNRKLLSQMKARENRRKEEKLKLTQKSNEIAENDHSDPVQSNKKRPSSDPTDSPDSKKMKLSEVKGNCKETENEKPERNEELEDKYLYETTNALYDRKINGELVPISQPLLFEGGLLRPYQIDGYNWLKMLYENGMNGILADEMGLGKTVQCIALVSHLVSMGVKGPFLVCAPLSTVLNWLSEFQRFTPQLPVILYNGDRKNRTLLREKMLKVKKLNEKLFVLPVVISSYEIIMNDRKMLKHIEWKYLIVDEGQRIKNTECRLIKELRLYNATHRILLTGTPLQNSLSELWSLLNFLLPELFNDLQSFELWFDIERISQEKANEVIMANEQKDHIISMLHQILTPFMLRRLKSDVEMVIPPKKEIMVFCPLTKLQQIFYKATLDNTIENLFANKVEAKVKTDVKGRPLRRSTKQIDYKYMLEKETKSEKKKTWTDYDEKKLIDWINKVAEEGKERRQEKSSKSSFPAPNSVINLKMNNVMMMLRKICNHPYLIEHPLNPKTGELLLNNDLIKHSGKMGMLDRMLPELKKNKHKVLIFSQFVHILNILEDYCYLKNYSYSRLDGSYGFKERQEEIDTFNKDERTFIFLLSTRAGGLGINLVAADTVIIYDSDWNPQCDLQAQDRCHRIGQVKPVVVYRLVTRNTIDQKVVERATAKRKLEKMIIHKGKFKCGIKNFSTSLTSMNPHELSELLQSSDHKEIYEGENRSSIISQSYLEKMLDRSDLLNKMEETKKGFQKTVPENMCKEIEGVFKVIETDDNATELENI